MKQKARVLAYMRVSKRTGMTVENQRPILESWIDNNISIGDGYSEILWVTEEESTRKTRPKREMSMNLLRTKEYNLLLCARLDRWGRSTIELVTSIQELVEKDIRVVFVQNGFDWGISNFNAMSKFQLDVLAAFANLERELIRERTLEGLARAKSEGKQLGRPMGAKDKGERRKAGYLMRWASKKTKDKYQGGIIQEETIERIDKPITA